jgi:hypothetical protein
VPYQIAVQPLVLNNFEDTDVTVTGEELPPEIVRISLGEYDQFMEVVENSGHKIRFRVPGGFPTGSHPIHINKRRTNQSIKVKAPKWEQIIPTCVRKPWEGFGDIVIRISGTDLPESPDFTLGSPHVTDQENPAVDPLGVFTALKVAKDRASHAESTEDTGDIHAVGIAPSTVYAVEFAEECPVGQHRLYCNGLDTGLVVAIDDALPDPKLDRRGIAPETVLNYREPKVRLSGKHFHSSMVVDLGEGAPENFELTIKPGSDGVATLTLPAGFLPRSYPIRINRVDFGAQLEVRQVEWTGLKPESISLKQKHSESPQVGVRGTLLPKLDQEAGDFYTLRNSRAKVIEEAIIKTTEKVVEDANGDGESDNAHAVALAEYRTWPHTSLFW